MIKFKKYLSNYEDNWKPYYKRIYIDLPEMGQSSSTEWITRVEESQYS